MHTLDSQWNPTRMQQLEQLYRKGLCFRLIAEEIGVSRSAAIAKSHRMRLPKREPPPSKPLIRNPPRRRLRREASLRVQPMIESNWPKIDPGQDYSCTICELTDVTCRYPLWPTSAPHSERRYCGRPQASVSTGVPYCRHHSQLCDNPRQS